MKKNLIFLFQLHKPRWIHGLRGWIHEEELDFLVLVAQTEVDSWSEGVDS
jgi:hypothetical protein